MTTRNKNIIGWTIGVVVALVIIAVTAIAVSTRWDVGGLFSGQSSRTTELPDSLRVVTSNLDSPWSIAFLGDTAFISSRNTGEIIELLADGETRLVGRVEGSVHSGESGLLGLAVDDRSRLYAYFTTADDNRIARFDLEGSAGTYRLGQSEVILDGLPKANIHSGGRIAFGPDDMLYATVGDVGDTDLPQDRDSLAGKILRMESDGSAPEDNPFSDSLVYSYGHRNPQGMAWSTDGTMYATEFGQNTWDELNIITAGSNYGWPEVEGVGSEGDFVDPVLQWEPSEASPSGMAYHDGLLYIANLRGEVLRVVSVDDLSSSEDLYADELGRIRDAVVSPSGELWFVANNTDGRGTPAQGDDRIYSIISE